MQYKFTSGTKNGTKGFFYTFSKTQKLLSYCFYWCRGGDSNPHEDKPRWILNTIYVISKYPITVIQSKLYKQLQLLTNFEQYPIYVMVLFLNAL